MLGGSDVASRMPHSRRCLFFQPNMTASAHSVQLSEHLQRASKLRRQGQLAQARAVYERILDTDPGQGEALHQLGIIVGRTGDFAKAAELIGRAIDIDPTNAAACSDRGVALKALRQWDAALASYDRAIALQPSHAEAHNNRGNVLRELGRWEAALASYDRAIALAPRYPEAHNNRGVLLNDLHQWAAALASYDQAIAERPDYANAHCNRGVALERIGRLDEALASYNQAIRLDGNFVQALANRGNVQRDLRQLDAALASCERAIALRPDHAEAHQNKAIALLLLGDLQNGWREYEWRWKNERSPLMQDKRSYPQPRWLGRPSLSGRTILLQSEQGLGDTLQFSRYATMAAHLGARVVLEAPQPLVSLLRNLEGSPQVVARGAALPPFDCWAPLMSLPLAFDTTLANVPAAVPYLRSGAEKSSHWKKKLGEKTRPRIGLVWSGGFRPGQPELWSLDRRRNIPLASLAALKRADVEFYSLQKGQPAEAELEELVAANWDGPSLQDFTHELHDFEDTAALIQELDLIISVDTSTAHLAGALGKPVWILNRFDSCWRWLLDRADSPWYPTARLYRQESAGHWDGVVQRVREDLARLFS